MDSQRDGYNINPETGKQIKIGEPTWKRLAAKYYRIGDTFTDQTIPDSRAYASNKIFGMKLATPKPQVTRRKRVANPAIEGNEGERSSPGKRSFPKYVYVGSKAWNDLYNLYEWDGHEFGEKRQRPLPGYLNTVEKRREMRRNKAFERFDHKVSQGRLSDVIDSSLGYALMYYHTMEGDMYKEWMKEKRTKNDFRLKIDDDNRLWVRLPGEKSEEEVEPISLVFDESSEFN